MSSKARASTSTARRPALLEVLDGRAPVPPRRAAVPRRGRRDRRRTPSRAAETDMAGPGSTTRCAADAGEQRGDPGQRAGDRAERARTGSARSARTHRPARSCAPSSGRTRRHGVAEVAMGTPLTEVIDEHRWRPARRSDGRGAVGRVEPVPARSSSSTPRLSYEAMQAAGSGLGTGGFIVFDDTVDLVAVAQGVSRFLAVESCGQCTPCKQDGLVPRRRARPLAALGVDRPRRASRSRRVHRGRRRPMLPGHPASARGRTACSPCSPTSSPPTPTDRPRPPRRADRADPRPGRRPVRARRGPRRQATRLDLRRRVGRRRSRRPHRRAGGGQLAPINTPARARGGPGDRRRCVPAAPRPS